LYLVSTVASLSLFLSASADPGDPAVVEKVFDGDTILVSILGTKEKVRLIGVDTPEKNHPLKPVQFFSKEAKLFLEQLAGGQSVLLEYERQKRDKYGRLLAYVFLEGGRLVNAEIIKEGFGFVYLKYPFQRSDEFKRYEEQARKGEKGLWRNQGRDEWEWLIMRHRKPFKVYEMAANLWGMEFDGLLKLRLDNDELLLELANLRIWIHEYRKDDLRKVLFKNGWIEKKRDRGRNP
jgi:micrococcal nuclease